MNYAWNKNEITVNVLIQAPPFCACVPVRVPYRETPFFGSPRTDRRRRCETSTHMVATCFRFLGLVFCINKNINDMFILLLTVSSFGTGRRGMTYEIMVTVKYLSSGIVGIMNILVSQ